MSFVKLLAKTSIKTKASFIYVEPPPENLLEVDGEEGLILLESGEGIELNE